MKSLKVLSVLAFAVLLFSNKSSNAQKLEVSSVTPLLKTSLKATKWTFGYNDDGSAYQAQFITPKGKGKTIVDTYNFDPNLQLVNQTSEVYTNEEANVKANKIRAKKDPTVKFDPNRKLREAKTTYVKVGIGAFNTVLEHGVYTATEKWDSKKGDYVWDVSYGEGKEEKLKSDDRRITAQFSIADDPEEFRKVGFWNWDESKKMPYEVKYHAPQHFLTVMGVIKPKIKKTKETKIVDNQSYVLQTFMVNNGVKFLYERIFSFRGPKIVVKRLEYSDGSMGVLFAPQDRVSQLGFDQSILYKPNEYTYMHFGIDGSTIDSIDFVCPTNAWTPDLFKFTDKSLYLAGPGSNANPQKYYWEIKDKKDHMVIMKITEGKMDFITATPVADYTTKMVKPENQKKGFDGDVFETTNAQLQVRENGDIVIVGQYQYRGKNLDYMLLHFDPSGNLLSHYTVKNETPGAGEVELYENPGGKTITWQIIETQKADKDTGRKFNYVRLASVNPEARTLSQFTTFGLKTSKEQKDDYFLHPVVPVIVEDTCLIFVGSDKNDKNIWLAKVDLGE
ncbi:MAG: hypothetical protein H6537_10400 [Bacteroidales bacterium]|nr:hypothetical protein [Bacteroidales bacterium]HPD95450.1 hypothetical protein [Tenuifilaceae bacterium]HRX31718.1 hypothetical protein [Tenuifilaceae bacterium]